MPFSDEQIRRMQEQARALVRGRQLENTLLRLIAEVDARQVEEAFDHTRGQLESER